MQLNGGKASPRATVLADRYSDERNLGTTFGLHSGPYE